VKKKINKDNNKDNQLIHFHNPRKQPPYIIAIAPATRANIAPETRLTPAPLPLGTAVEEAEAEEEALVLEAVVLDSESDEVVAVVAAELEALVRVVAVVLAALEVVVVVASVVVLASVVVASAVVLVVDASVVLVDSAEVVVVGAAVEVEAEPVAPTTVK
jgi:hypothetical protein